MAIHVGIDVGGTFTDVAVSVPGENRLIRHKLPSSPERPDRAIVEGLAAVLDAHGLAPGNVVRLSHGTTVGTNALIERRCGSVAVVTTDGFRDLLEIRRQTRPKVYDVHLDHPPPLVPRERRHEVAERMRADGVVHRPLDEDGVRRIGERLAQEEVDCVVVCFLHSYAHPAHEARAVAILREMLPGRTHVLASTSVYPEFREYERFSTAVLNGALLTVMADYLDRFTAEVAALGVPAEPSISQSAGGLMSVQMARRLPVRATLSGPAAGVLGTAYRIARTGHRDVITLDVGGTSADVSLLAGGVPAELGEQALAGFPVRMPALDVNAVGAGGGSIAWIDVDGLLKVGPRSAGANPGPACYGLGGEDATVTDANVVLGRLDGEALLDGRMPIERALAERAVARIADRLGLGLAETARGIVRLACATVVAAIRKISVERGHDPGGFALFAFGGAGPLLGGEVASGLGIRTVLVPASPGILCAEGLLNCDLRADLVRTALMPLDDDAAPALNVLRDLLLDDAERWFAEERLEPDRRRLEWALDLRYRGQNFELVLSVDDRRFTKARCRRLARSFHAAHARAYGFASPGEPIEFVSMKARATGVLDEPVLPTLERTAPGAPSGTREVMFDDGRWHRAALYRRESLGRGQTIEGPAVVEQLDTTTLVYPGDTCVVDDWGNLTISRGQISNFEAPVLDAQVLQSSRSDPSDPFSVELLRHALTSVCDEMYVALMKSAYSTNIKERKDHSAAIFDAEGRVVVQGESLPLHLASMLGLVEVVLQRVGRRRLRPGDMFVSNDPFVGRGSHLPDVALVAPVFHEGELACFVADIAHHADIGGMAPGSMAGGMTEVYQEGLRIPPVRIARRGRVVDDVLDLILLNVRVPEERRGDYMAQIAANKLGERRMAEVLSRWPLARFREGCAAVIDAVSRRMRAGVAGIRDGEYAFEDVMDDDGMGTRDIPFKVRVVVEGEQILFDFTGSSPQVPGNVNISIAGLHASVLYALKVLVDPDGPTNHGMLEPVRFVAPEGSIVNAVFPAATAARAQACQRVIDVVLGALAEALPERVIAASNGANGVCAFSGYGPDGRYYVYMETIGGGAGARAYKDGTDGVQVHVTNTSNLPIESLEKEYPLLIERYELVEDSGGAGTWRGGLGLRRVYRPIGHTTMFSGQGERCASRPWGLFGGQPGGCGGFELERDDGRVEALPFKPMTLAITPDAAVAVTTPGAGGYGPPAERAPERVAEDLRGGKFSTGFADGHYAPVSGEDGLPRSR